MILKEGRGTRGGGGGLATAGSFCVCLSELLLRVSTVYIFGPVFLPSFHFLGNGGPAKGGARLPEGRRRPAQSSEGSPA